MISQAFAQTAAAQAPAPAAFDFLTLLPLLLMVVVIYFLMIRPQQKRMKEHRAMIAAIKRGDIVVTSGGLIAKVQKVIDDTTLQLELGEGLSVKAVRSTISEVRSKGDSDDK